MRNQKPNETNENKSSENEKLTIEKLKKICGFENISNEEAEKQINSYRIFSMITLALFQNQILK